MLYDRYHVRVFRFLLRRLGQDVALSEDILQETFIRAFGMIENFRDGNSFSAWIFSIAHNLCKNEYRRQSRNREDPGDTDFMSDAGDPMQDLLREEQQRTISRFIGQLPEESRLIFTLRFQEECSIKEIAEVIACAEGTVKSRLHYIIRKLSAYLDKKQITV